MINLTTSYYTRDELETCSFRSLGSNVKISRYARLYQLESISIGNNVRIDDFSILSGNINIGSNVHIAASCLLFSGSKAIHLHDFSGLSSRVSIYAESDDYSGDFLTNPTVPAQFKQLVGKDIILERHSIVGASSVILPGANVAEGVAIASLSLLKDSTDPWSIYGGIPAKKIKERSKDLLNLEKSLKELL